MKTAAKIMNIIGRVYNIIALVSTILMVIGGVVCLTISIVAPEAAIAEYGASREALITASIVLLVVSVCYFLSSLACLIIASRSYAAIRVGSKSKAPHILLMIAGILGLDIFYILAGVFGLVSSRR